MHRQLSGQRDRDQDGGSVHDRPSGTNPARTRKCRKAGIHAADLTADSNAPVDLPLTNETISAVAEFKQKVRAGLNS